MLALDASKYTGTVTADVIRQWKEAGIGLAILQAHPAGYGQARSLELMRVCEQEGLPWDAYIYEYMGAPDWQEGALATLDLAALEGLIPRNLWLDAEDVDTERGWPVEWRIEALRRDLALCDAWGAEHGLPRTGIYTALWWWPPKMGNTTEFSDRELWDADYDGKPDTEYGFTPYGGWTSRRVKQYAGTSTLVVGGLDLDVLSVEEAAELQGTQEDTADMDDAERRQYQEKIDGLVNAMGYVMGDVMKPLTRASAAKYVKTFVAEARRVAEQVGVNHS